MSKAPSFGVILSAIALASSPLRADISLLSRDLSGNPVSAEFDSLSASDDARWVVFVSVGVLDDEDDGGDADVFLYDTDADVIRRISRDPISGATSRGDCPRAAISGDGKTIFMVCDSDQVVLGSDGTGGRALFALERDLDGNGVLDEPGGVGVRRVDTDDDGAPLPSHGYGAISTSYDGSKILVSSGFTLALGCSDTDYALLDRDADGDGSRDLPGDVARRCVIRGNNSEPNQQGRAVLSGDGRTILFQASAPDRLAPADQNNASDAYTYVIETGSYELVGTTPEGVAGHTGSAPADISHDGRFVLFNSQSQDILPDGQGGGAFVKDRASGTIYRAASTRDPVSGSLRAVPGKGLDMTPDGSAVLIKQGGYPGFALVSTPPTPDAAFAFGPRELRIDDGFVRISGDLSRMALLSTALLTEAGEAFGRSNAYLIRRRVDVSMGVAYQPADLTIPGGDTLHQYTVRNDGNVSVSSAHVRIEFGPGADFVPQPGFPCVMEDDGLHCPIPRVYPGAEGGRIVRFKPNQIGDLTSQATLYNVPDDRTLLDNSASITTSVYPGVELAPSLASVATLTVGTTSNVFFALQNRRPIAGSANSNVATNVELELRFVDSLAINMASLSTEFDGGCQLDGQVLSCSHSRLEVDESRTVRVGLRPLSVGAQNVRMMASADQRIIGGAEVLETGIVLTAVGTTPDVDPIPAPPAEADEGGGGPMDLLAILTWIFVRLFLVLRSLLRQVRLEMRAAWSTPRTGRSLTNQPPAYSSALY